MPKVQLKASRAYYPADDEVKHFVRKSKVPRASTGRKCVVAGSYNQLIKSKKYNHKNLFEYEFFYYEERINSLNFFIFKLYL